MTWRGVKLALMTLSLAAIACGGGGGGGAATQGTTPSGGTNSGAASTDQAPTVPLTGPAEDLLVLFESLATKVKSAGDDCGAYADAVSAWTQDQSDEYQRLRAEVSQIQLPAEEERIFDDRLAAAMGAVVEVASKCGNHDRAWASFQAWDALMEGG